MSLSLKVAFCTCIFSGFLTNQRGGVVVSMPEGLGSILGGLGASKNVVWLLFSFVYFLYLRNIFTKM